VDAVYADELQRMNCRLFVPAMASRKHPRSLRPSMKSRR